MITTRETLLARLKADNAHDAWKEFFHLYWRAILRYARKLGLTGYQAEEVLQETMVALMRILPTFVYNRDKGRFRNFLLTIVHRKSLAALRRARRERESQVPLDEGTHENGDASDAGPAAEAEALNQWREALLADALRDLREDPTLGEKTFAIFEAYAIRKRPIAEVAGQFGLKENAIYQIKNRLLRRLERRMAQLVRNSGGE